MSRERILSRRDFLRLLGRAAAASVLAACGPSTQSPELQRELNSKVGEQLLTMLGITENTTQEDLQKKLYDLTFIQQAFKDQIVGDFYSQKGDKFTISTDSRGEPRTSKVYSDPVPVYPDALVQNEKRAEFQRGKNTIVVYGNQATIRRINIAFNDPQNQDTIGNFLSGYFQQFVSMGTIHINFLPRSVALQDVGNLGVVRQSKNDSLANTALLRRTDDKYPVRQEITINVPNIRLSQVRGGINMQGNFLDIFANERTNGLAREYIKDQNLEVAPKSEGPSTIAGLAASTNDKAAKVLLNVDPSVARSFADIFIGEINEIERFAPKR